MILVYERKINIIYNIMCYLLGAKCHALNCNLHHDMGQAAVYKMVDGL